MRRVLLVSIVAASIALPLSREALANHTGHAHAPAIGGQIYPQRGWHQLARYTDNAIFYLSSNRCHVDDNPSEPGFETNRWEVEFFDKAKNGTFSAPGQREFSGKWPSGFIVVRTPNASSNCSRQTSQEVADLYLEYLSENEFCSFASDPSSCKQKHTGGRGAETKASRSWCRVVNAPYRCGYEWGMAQLNLYKWDPNVRSDAWHPRELLHEVGHVWNLDHVCSEKSTMNDGANCHPEWWYEVTQYLIPERLGWLDQYPGWPYD